MPLNCKQEVKNIARLSKKKILELLTEAEKTFKDTKEVQNDAIEPILRYKRNIDKEFTGFIAAALAYGRIPQIKKNVHRVLDPMGDYPLDFLLESEGNFKYLSNWKHRFTSNSDIRNLLKILRFIYTNFGTIENFIDPNINDSGWDVCSKLHKKTHEIIKAEKLKIPKSSSFWYLIPDPERGSACKRLHLYLRWVVCNSSFDLNLWSKLPKKNLIIPVDTHVLKQSRKLGITKRKTADRKTADEITNFLKKLDPDDPVRFDFALCHIGVNKSFLTDPL